MAMEALTDDEHAALKVLTDEMNDAAHDLQFWRQDTANLLDVVRRRFGELMEDTVADVAVFAAFQIVTLNFAQMAVNQPVLREFMEIRKRWWKR